MGRFPKFNVMYGSVYFMHQMFLQFFIDILDNLTKLKEKNTKHKCLLMMDPDITVSMYSNIL
jgi:hypothetical protein